MWTNPSYIGGQPTAVYRILVVSPLQFDLYIGGQPTAVWSVSLFYKIEIESILSTNNGVPVCDYDGMSQCSCDKHLSR